MITTNSFNNLPYIILSDTLSNSDIASLEQTLLNYEQELEYTVLFDFSELISFHIDIAKLLLKLHSRFLDNDGEFILISQDINELTAFLTKNNLLLKFNTFSNKNHIPNYLEIKEDIVLSGEKLLSLSTKTTSLFLSISCNGILINLTMSDLISHILSLKNIPNNTIVINLTETKFLGHIVPRILIMLAKKLKMQNTNLIAVTENTEYKNLFASNNVTDFIRLLSSELEIH